jgi:hypothetical protein
MDAAKFVRRAGRFVSTHYTITPTIHNQSVRRTSPGCMGLSFLRNSIHETGPCPSWVKSVAVCNKRPPVDVRYVPLSDGDCVAQQYVAPTLGARWAISRLMHRSNRV